MEAKRRSRERRGEQGPDQGNVRPLPCWSQLVFWTIIGSPPLNFSGRAVLHCMSFLTTVEAEPIVEAPLLFFRGNPAGAVGVGPGGCDEVGDGPL